MIFNPEKQLSCMIKVKKVKSLFSLALFQKIYPFINKNVVASHQKKPHLSFESLDFGLS